MRLTLLLVPSGNWMMRLLVRSSEQNSVDLRNTDTNRKSLAFFLFQIDLRHVMSASFFIRKPAFYIYKCCYGGGRLYQSIAVTAIRIRRLTLTSQKFRTMSTTTTTMFEVAYFTTNM